MSVCLSICYHKQHTCDLYNLVFDKINSQPIFLRNACVNLIVQTILRAITLNTQKTKQLRFKYIVVNHNILFYEEIENIFERSYFIKFIMAHCFWLRFEMHKLFYWKIK